MTPWMCGDNFGQVMPHHESVLALWKHEWEMKCKLNIYPFHFCRIEDMKAIIDELASKGINDAYDDKWTETFIPHLLRFEQLGQKAEAEGDYKAAQDFYLSLGMISRFPMIDSATKREAWSIQKRLYLKGTSFWESPVSNIYIPFAHGLQGEGSTMQFLLRRPPISSAAAAIGRAAPVLVVLTGLDGYRTDSPPAVAHHAVSLGYAVIHVEIPGTGDAPGAPGDPLASDRQLATLLDWIAAQAGLDEKKVAVWGTSTGAYDAMRAAHVHHDRVGLAIAQGGACDLAFSREWLDKADGGEYSFSLTRALMTKLGYDSVEEMKEGARDKFSLVKTGVFDMPCTKLLLLNGINDTIFPVEDTIMPTMYGSPKELRLVPNRAHMGEPQTAQYIKKAFEDFVKEN